MNDESPAWQKLGFKSQEHLHEYISNATERRKALFEKLASSEKLKAALEKYDYKAMKNKTNE